MEVKFLNHAKGNNIPPSMINEHTFKSERLFPSVLLSCFFDYSTPL